MLRYIYLLLRGWPVSPLGTMATTRFIIAHRRPLRWNQLHSSLEWTSLDRETIRSASSRILIGCVASTGTSEKQTILKLVIQTSTSFPNKTRNAQLVGRVRWCLFDITCMLIAVSLGWLLGARFVACDLDGTTTWGLSRTTTEAQLDTSP